MGHPILGCVRCWGFHWLEFCAAVDWDAGSGDPACFVGGEEGYYVGDVFGFAEALDGLHSESEFAACFCLGEVRYVGVDYAGCDGVDAYAARAEDGGPVFDQGFECSFG